MKVSRRTFIQGATAASVATVVLAESPLEMQAAYDSSSDPLVQSFQQPPLSAKAHIQYHFLTDIRRIDITRDFEAMKRNGVQGALVFPAARPYSLYEPDRITMLKQLFLHAMQEANRLGMEVSLKHMAGQTVMRGFWIEQEHAAKKPVWSEVEVTGPRERFHIAEKPETQDGFYRDVAVLAFQPKVPAKPHVNRIQAAGAKITSSAAVRNAARALDGNPSTAAVVRCIRVSDFPSKTADAWMQAFDCFPDPKWITCEFPEPYAASSVFVRVNNLLAMPVECELQQSEDGGETYSTILRFEARMDEPITVPFPETRSRFFRLVITNNNSTDGGNSFDLCEFDLLKQGEQVDWPVRINHWRLRTGQAPSLPWYDPEVLERHSTEVNPEGADLALEDVVDLTARVLPDGRLEWDVPPGRWTILRFGYTLYPGNPYRCDVLSKAAATAAFNGVPLDIIETAGPLAGKTLKFLHEDSWEVHDNMVWTPAFPAEFQRRMKYDMQPYLPALAGKVVTSGDITDRFLWDYRRTCADLMADNYVGTFSELCRKHGMGFHEEIPGGYNSGLFDGLQLHARADSIAGEFWARSEEVEGRIACWEVTSRRFGDSLVTAASAAHTTGKKLVLAESFSKWGNYFSKGPFDLKDIGDRAFCRGVNLFQIMSTGQQDNERYPGRSFPFADDLQRNNTWWHHSRAWLEYIARCEFLLQQGLYQADLCYLNGESVPSAVPGREYMEPPVPAGYSYDGCSTEVLHERMAVKDGRLVLPDGMSYRVLVLPVRDTMTPETLRRIAELVRAGAVVVGPRPQRSPSLSGYPKCDEEVARIGGQLWGDCDGKTVLEHRFGKGRVFWGKTPGEVLAQLGIEPDFEYVSRQADADVMYIRRTSGAADMYFISNQRNRYEELDCTFRVRGKVPELWHPDTGRTVSQPVYQEHGQRTALTLRLEPRGSVFVVFRRAAQGERIVSLTLNGQAVETGISGNVQAPPAIELAGTDDGAVELTAWQSGRYEMQTAAGGTARVQVPTIPSPLGISGPWEVRFPEGWGPDSVLFPTLISWTEHEHPEVKHFSGTATYVKEIDIPRNMLDGKALFLDLGQLQTVAEVRLNGKNLGILWKPSFRVEITAAARSGQNLLEVLVTNLWPNRLIGDAALPVAQRRTWTESQLYTVDWPLFESGLLGPVRIHVAERKTISLG